MLLETPQRPIKSVVMRIITVYAIFNLLSRIVSKNLLQIDNVFVPAVGDRDSDDLRQNSSALFPPEYYVNYLQQTVIQSAIGAEVRYQECPDAPFELFTKTGDVSRLILKWQSTYYESGCEDMASAAWCLGELKAEVADMGMLI